MNITLENLIKLTEVDHRLNEIKEAKEYCAEQGYPIKLSLLTNEGCWGNCPIMPEHYHYNNTRDADDPQYFNSRISRVSCSKWDALDGAASLKAANLPPWKEDWQEFNKKEDNTKK